MKTFASILLLMSLAFDGQSQNDSSQTGRHPYIGITIGFASMKIRDQLVMPVKYRGTNFAFGINYLKKKPKSIQEINVDAVIGGVKTKEANIDNIAARYIEPRAALYYTDINYVWMHKINPLTNEKYRTYFGASAYFMGNVRFSERWDNSAINYEAAFSPLAFQGKVERDFDTWRKYMTVSFSLNFPVLVYVIRPEFSGVPDFLDHETDFISSLVSTPNSQWTGFWSFPRFKTMLDIALPIRSQNFLKFSYKWEYYSFQQPMKTQFGGHYFLFTLYTHL